MIDRLISCLMALSLAFLSWLYVRSRDQETLDNVPVPVRISLAQPDQYEMDVPDPCHIVASFSGPPSRMRELRNMLHHGEMLVEITLPVAETMQNESPYLESVVVNASDLHPPQGITSIVVEGRNRVPVTLHRLVQRNLPVRFNHLLEDRVAGGVIEPQSVQVRGPREVLDRARDIATQLYVLPQGNDNDQGIRDREHGAAGTGSRWPAGQCQPDFRDGSLFGAAAAKSGELNDIPCSFFVRPISPCDPSLRTSGPPGSAYGCRDRRAKNRRRWALTST